MTGLFESSDAVPSSAARRRAAMEPGIDVIAARLASRHPSAVSAPPVAALNAARYSSVDGYAPDSAASSRPAAHQCFARAYWLTPENSASRGSRLRKS